MVGSDVAGFLFRIVRATLPWVALFGAGCAATTYQPFRDKPDYVSRVLEDVTAMLEGMANAHAPDREVLRDPGTRSSRQPAGQ